MRKLAELVEDNLTAETLLDIVGLYVEVAEHAGGRGLDCRQDDALHSAADNGKAGVQKGRWHNHNPNSPSGSGISTMASGRETEGQTDC